jgi:hypothetical protein
MTVAELIAELQKMPQDATVAVPLEIHEEFLGWFKPELYLRPDGVVTIDVDHDAWP